MSIVQSYPLTVLIPTYNRKDKLLRTLLALKKQTNEKFNIIISDNKSNYSIKEEILPLLDNKFSEKVQIFEQPFNVGGAANIVGLLGLCKSKWGWMLGDDDLVNENAIDIIYKKIEQFPDAKLFWFSLELSYKEEEYFCSMEELKTMLYRYHNGWDFIFCSNKIYDISSIGEYMDLTYRYLYTRIAQCFPFMEMLKGRGKVAVIGSESIVEHAGFDGGVITWDVNKTISGLRTLIDYETGLDWRNHCIFVKEVMFGPKFILKNYLSSKEIPWNYRIFLMNVYHDCYLRCYPLLIRIPIYVSYKIASTRIGFWVLKKMFYGGKRR